MVQCWHRTVSPVKMLLDWLVWGLFVELFGEASRLLGGGRKVYLGGLMVGIRFTDLLGVVRIGFS